MQASNYECHCDTRSDAAIVTPEVMPPVQSSLAREETAEKNTEKLSGTAEKLPDGGLCS